MGLTSDDRREIEADPEVVAAARALATARKFWAGEQATLEYRADNDLGRLAEELRTAREKVTERRTREIAEDGTRRPARRRSWRR